MIPKIIHYCWFGGKEKPAEVKQLIAQWHALHPDYEIREWNETNFDVNQYAYTREAYATQNYAHVSDVARLYALYLYGGIYLDTDVEVIGSFDPFLEHRSFCCAEHKWLGTGALGAQAQAYWVKLFLDYYASHHFITWWGHEQRTANTKILTLKIWPQIPPPLTPIVYETDYFCAKNWHTGAYCITENTVCIHHYSGSWSRKHKTWQQRIHRLFRGLKIRYFLGHHR